MVTGALDGLKFVFAIIYVFTKWLPFKNFEKCFSFNLKISFCSWDIQIFATFSLLSKYSRLKRTHESGIIKCHELACIN